MVYIDSGLGADRPISYVVTDNFEGGTVAGVNRWPRERNSSASPARRLRIPKLVKLDLLRGSNRFLSIDQYSGDSYRLIEFPNTC